VVKRAIGNGHIKSKKRKTLGHEHYGRVKWCSVSLHKAKKRSQKEAVQSVPKLPSTSARTIIVKEEHQKRKRILGGGC